jgi:hypothetical protein
MIDGEIWYFFLGGVVALLTIWRVSKRYVNVVPGEFTYVVVGDEGFRRILVRSEFLWNPFEWIFRGSDVPDLSFTTIEQGTEKLVQRRLLDQQSGKVDLLVHVLHRRFSAKSRDQRTLEVDAKLNFRLDGDLIHYTLEIGDFGSVLANEVEAAIYMRLSKIDDNEVGKNIDALQIDVLSDLNQIREQLRAESKSTALPLGVSFIGVKIKVNVLKPSMAGAGGEASASAAESISISVMSYDAEGLDAIQNVFLGKHERLGEPLKAANAAILQMLEMHARQSIAQSLIQTGNLVVLTAEELGITRGVVLHDHLSERKQLPPGSDLGRVPISNGGVEDKA